MRKIKVYKLKRNDGAVMYVDGDGNVYGQGGALNGLGGIFSNIGNIFKKKEGGSAVGNFLRKASPFSKYNRDRRNTGSSGTGVVYGPQLDDILRSQGHDLRSAGISDVSVTDIPVDFLPRERPDLPSGPDEKGDRTGMYIALGLGGAVIIAGTVYILNN